MRGDAYIRARPSNGQRATRGSGKRDTFGPPVSEVRVISRHAVGAVFAFALVAVVVAVDVLFFKHRFWERLAANIGLVLVFGAFYFRFLNSR